MMLVQHYKKEVEKRPYKRLLELAGDEVLFVSRFELIANFSFVPASQNIIKQKLSCYRIDAHDFSIHFDGATFEYYPKQLKVTVYVFQHHYSFDFTKPQHLGQPRSKNTETMLLGQAPK